MKLECIRGECVIVDENIQSVQPDPAIAAASNTDRFYTQVKSLRDFDKIEVQCVIANLLSKTSEENCHFAMYLRTIGNVGSLLRLNASKDVQAIAMIARALFELSVDARLLEKIPNGWLRATAHADVEKLRLAQRIIKFKESEPRCANGYEGLPGLYRSTFRPY